MPLRPVHSARAAVLVTAAVLALVLCGLTGSALAHTSLTFADPPPGSRVGRPPAQVQLRFAKQSVPDPRNEVTVVGPTGENIAKGPPAVTGLGISQRLSPARVVGVYVVSYTVTSSDRHLTKGGYSFLLTTAAAAPAATHSVPVWQWILAAAGFVAVVVVGSVFLRSRQRPER